MLLIKFYIFSQMINKLYVVFLLRLIRSLYSGAIAALSIYFFYRDVTFQEARDIPLCISWALLVAAIKAYAMLRFRKYFGHFNCLIFSYILNMVALITACDPNLALNGSTYAFSKYFTIGCFPFDGEDFGVCQFIEREYLLKIVPQKDMPKIHKKYQRIGYIFQAFGSLALGYYYFIVMENTLDEKLKMHELLVFFLLLQFICILINFQLSTGKGTQVFTELLNEPKSQQKVTIDLKVRLATFFQGFCYGLLSVNFLIYYCELRLDFYYHQIGTIVCAYFLFKGIGQDLIPKFLAEYPKLINWIYFLTNLAVANVAFFTASAETTILLCCAFLFWNLGRSQIANIINKQPPTSQLRDDLRLYQRVGVALGVAATAYSFATMYYRFIFAYPFILYAVVRQINHFLISSLKTDVNYVPVIQEKLEKGTYSNTTQAQLNRREQNPDLQYQQQLTLFQAKLMKRQAPKSHRQTIHRIIRFILYTILTLGLLFFYHNSIHDGEFYKVFQLMYQRGSFQRSKQLRLFNASLGQYLAKQNIKMIRTIDSNNDYNQSYLQRQSIQEMNVKYQKPQWLHFSEAPYFNSQAQIEAFFAPLLQINHDQGDSLKGFSVFWKNPLRYHKIREELRQKVRALGERIGFYYQQMASLNLRGVEDKIVLVFGREERKRAPLPKFVENPPPRNLLAFQTTFKMVMNLPEMREFILYHLRAGVDKFFLYDNDPIDDDPSLFEGNRVTGYFKRCPRFALDQRYQIFQEIWEQFYDHIIYIPYTTSGLNINLGPYPQFQAYQHYAAFFRQVTKYTSFTDFDEFIYSFSRQKITDTLTKLQKEQDIATNYIISKHFQFHVCSPRKLNIQTYNYTQFPQIAQGQKIIMMNELIVRSNVHGRSAKNGQVAFSGQKKFPHKIWHYQLTTKFMKTWMKHPISQFGLDKSMQRLVPGLKEACKGKCTDSFISNCTKQHEAIVLKEYCQPWKGQQIPT